MAQNSKDVLFKSQVNNYIGEKLSQSGTTPTFSVTNDGNGNYTISQFNGNVTLTTDGTNYIFTPQRGNAVTIAASSVTSIIVDFITLHADASLLDGETVTGSGIVSLTPFSTIPNANLTNIQSAVLSATIGTSTSTTLDSLNIGSPTIGRIINISQGEVALNNTLTMPSNTAISVASGSNLTLTQTQASGASISGQYTINTATDTTPPATISPTAFTFTDTGSSSTDGITSNGTISLALATDTASWQYSTDGGTTWTNGSGSSFTLSNGTYDKQNIKVKQFDGAGNSSISSMSTFTDSSMVQLEAIGVTNGYYAGPQITTLTNGEFAVTFYGADSGGDYSIFVQKFNADGTTTGNSMVQLEAIDKTNGDDRYPQITALTSGEFAVTFYGYDSVGGSSIFVQKFNADGTTTGNSMVQLEAIASAYPGLSNPQITALENGEFAVTFSGVDSTADSSIFIQKFNTNGTTTGNSMVQLEAIGVTSGNDMYPQITALQNGEFAVTFYGKDSDVDYSIFVQKFNADGTTAGSMVQLEALNVTNGVDYDSQITALENGEFVVTFLGEDSTGNYSVFVQKFNANGTTTGSMVQLEAIGVTNGDDRYPQITALTNGEFAVIFYKTDSAGDNSIFVQKFNANGTTAGSMVQLETINNTNVSGYNPQITALENGEFAVTFSGVDSIGDDWSIFVQKFNADGTTTGSMVQLEAINNIYGQDRNPQITTLTNGEFTVAFSGSNTMGSSIFVQKFNADGTLAAHPSNVLKVDSTTPTAATTNPITNTDTNNDSTGVYAAGDKIAFAFSEPIHATTLTLSDILLNNSHSFGSGATLTALNSVNGFASNFEITLGTAPTIAANDTLTIVTTEAVDVAGNANSSGINYTVPAITAVATPTFTATNTSGVITFDGTATGNISLAIDSGTVTFTKGSVTAATTVALADITKITLAAGQTIADSAADLTKPIDGAGNVVATGTAGEDVLYIYTSGTNSITGGAGSEMIWLGSETLGLANGGVDTMIIANGDSSVGTPDQIVYFELDKDKLDLPSVVIATTSTDVSDVTVGGVTVGQTTITNGIATFQAADNTTSVDITSADALSAALGYLAGAIADAETVAFTYDLGSGNSDTYIFQGGANDTDIVVDLVGVSVTGADLTAILM